MWPASERPLTSLLRRHMRSGMLFTAGICSLTGWPGCWRRTEDAMGQVLGVHGIAQEQRGRNQLLEEWGLGLADGVEAAAGLSAAVPSFDLCFYGDLFLPPSAQGERQPAGKAAIGRDPLTRPLSEDDVQFLGDVVAEVEAAYPDLGPAMGAPRVPEVLQPLAQRLTRRMNGGLALQLLGVLRQVKVYLDDQVLAGRIRSRLLAGLEGAPRVVIGHSLGSVVAFDTLRLNPDLSVSMLVTVGSPLGMQAVQSRLRHPGGPSVTPLALSGVSRWVNLYDPGDPVAAAGGLSRVWPIVEDFTVGNGTDPHAIRAYLGKQVTGRAVLDGVSG